MTSSLSPPPTAPLLRRGGSDSGGMESAAAAAERVVLVPRWRRAAGGAGAGGARAFADNAVTTSRYTALDFVPRFLLAQFARFANAYFLVVCVLQSIRAISITDGVPTSAIPLAVILLFDGIITAREDWLRHLDDARANASAVLVLQPPGDAPAAFAATPWRDVRVGDVVKVVRGAAFPADLVFLGAAGADRELCGTCHVQTAQLDGETSLKLRQAPASTAALLAGGSGVDDGSDAAAATLALRIVCEEPTAFFDRFSGALALESEGNSEAAARAPLPAAPVPLDATSMLLRGCVLRNADFVYGAVVYTGMETKVRVKQHAARAKRAAVEDEIDGLVLALLALLAVLCISGAVGNAVASAAAQVRAPWYLALPAFRLLNILTDTLTYFLLIANLIPIRRASKRSSERGGRGRAKGTATRRACVRRAAER